MLAAIAGVSEEVAPSPKIKRLVAGLGVMTPLVNVASPAMPTLLASVKPAALLKVTELNAIGELPPIVCNAVPLNVVVCSTAVKLPLFVKLPVRVKAWLVLRVVDRKMVRPPLMVTGAAKVTVVAVTAFLIVKFGNTLVVAELPIT